jgi:hypothetical protein
MLERLKNEPAFLIGVIASCILAVVTVLNGSALISDSLAATLQAALDPTGGWAIPIILGLITRFFVYGPKTAQTLLNTPPPAAAADNG